MTGQLLRRVLVVEDEILVAMLVEDMVRDLGHEVVGPAMTLDVALQLAEEASVDCAILDVNLGEGTPSTPVAVILAARHIPFLFATGYGAAGANSTFATAPVLEKPFVTRHLDQALRRLLA